MISLCLFSFEIIVIAYPFFFAAKALSKKWEQKNQSSIIESAKAYIDQEETKRARAESGLKRLRHQFVAFYYFF